jgi:predicted TIM-barrel fold metal-dependent hydrolase
MEQEAVRSEVPWIVSVDDHITEPATMFDRWLPQKYRGRAPRVERHHVRPTKFSDRGKVSEIVQDRDAPLADVWVYGKAQYIHRLSTVIRDGEYGAAESRQNQAVTYDDMRPGCYDPKARLQDMDTNHVQASLGFPSFPRFCGQAFTEQSGDDRELGLAVVRAYNDWVVEEWCGDSGGRLIPLCLVPLWDADLAAAEVVRNAARGVRAVAFSEVPYYLGLPSIHSGYWNPFFTACNDTGTVVCMHIGSSSQMVKTSPDAPGVVQTALSSHNSMVSLVDFMFSGVLERFENLKLAYSEGQIGWIPYMLERLDAAYLDHPGSREGLSLSLLPSERFRRQVFGCFFNDVHGAASAGEIGIDNLTFETDYPHADGTFPHAEKIVAAALQHLDPADQHKIIRGNAIKLFQLDLPESPAT